MGEMTTLPLLKSGLHFSQSNRPIFERHISLIRLRKWENSVTFEGSSQGISINIKNFPYEHVIYYCGNLTFLTRQKRQHNYKPVHSTPHVSNHLLAPLEVTGERNSPRRSPRTKPSSQSETHKHEFERNF